MLQLRALVGRYCGIDSDSDIEGERERERERERGREVYRGEGERGERGREGGRERE